MFYLRKEWSKRPLPPSKDNGRRKKKCSLRGRGSFLP